MTLDLDHLRRVAEAATPGPWEQERDGHIVCEATVRGDLVAEASHWTTDAAHIAAFDPPTVLALIDRLEAAEAKVARVAALADDMFNDEQMHIEVALGGALFAGRAIRDALSGDLTASEDDGGPEGHRDDDNAGDGRCGAQEGKR